MRRETISRLPPCVFPVNAQGDPFSDYMVVLLYPSQPGLAAPAWLTTLVREYDGGLNVSLLFSTFTNLLFHSA
jgi:hypothetical protein